MSTAVDMKKPRTTVLTGARKFGVGCVDGGAAGGLPTSQIKRRRWSEVPLRRSPDGGRARASSRLQRRMVMLREAITTA